MAALRLPPLPTIKEILKIYKLQALKQLSQNFILDERLCDKIIGRAKIVPKSYVLEVGPGPGGLTRSIMKTQPKRLLVVEKDKRFKPMLDMLTESFETVNGKMDIIYDDILNINMSNMFPESARVNWNDQKPEIFLIGNLPFSVSTHLIIKWLHQLSEQSGAWSYGRTKMTLTFQKEVAERITAKHKDEQRCRLSIMSQTWTFPVLHFVIPGAAFLPRPDVDVGVVSFLPLVKPRTNHEFKLFEKVVRQIFSFRQKHCVRGIETLFPLHCRKELGNVMCKLSDVDPQAKPYHLTVEDFDRLCTAYKYLIEKHPDIEMYEYRAPRRVLGMKYTKNIDIEEYENVM